jgi:hypothetical protein
MLLIKNTRKYGRPSDGLDIYLPANANGKLPDEPNQIRYKSVFFLFHALNDYPEAIFYTFIKKL